MVLHSQKISSAPLLLNLDKFIQQYFCQMSRADQGMIYMFPGISKISYHLTYLSMHVHTIMRQLLARDKNAHVECACTKCPEVTGCGHMRLPATIDYSS